MTSLYKQVIYPQLGPGAAGGRGLQRLPAAGGARAGHHGAAAAGQSGLGAGGLAAGQHARAQGRRRGQQGVHVR